MYAIRIADILNLDDLSSSKLENNQIYFKKFNFLLYIDCKQ